MIPERNHTKVNKKNKLIWTRIIRLLLLVLSLAYIVYFFVNNHETLEVTFTMNWKVLSAIILLQLIFFVLQGWRFQIVLEKCAEIRLPFLPWLKIFILGRFLNVLFSQLGNVYRGVRLKKDYNISYTRYISGFASMAWIDTLMNLVIAVGVVLWFEPGLHIGHFTAWKILVVAFLLFLLGPISFEWVFRQWKVNHPKLLWIHNKLSEVLHVTLRNLRDVAFLSKVFLLGVLLFIRTVLVFHLYWNVLGVSVSLSALAIFYALFKLSFFATLTPGNLGIQELAWGFLSEQMNIGMGQGILMSGLVRVVSSLVMIVLGLLLGGPDLIRRRKQYTSQKQITEEPA